MYYWFSQIIFTNVVNGLKPFADLKQLITQQFLIKKIVLLLKLLYVLVGVPFEKVTRKLHLYG